MSFLLGSNLSTGGSTGAQGVGGVVQGWKFTAAHNGIINDIFCYCNDTDGLNAHCAVYADIDDVNNVASLLATSNTVAIGTSLAWVDFPLSPGLYVTAGTSYFLVVQSQGGNFFTYKVSGTTGYTNFNGTYPTFPNSINFGAGGSPVLISIYATGAIVGVIQIKPQTRGLT